MKTFRFAPLVLVLSLAVVVPANAGLIINAGLDGTINTDPNSAAIVATINTAIGAYQSLFSNNLTVKIYFQEGGGLGQSNFFLYNGPNYSKFYNGLVANNSNAAAVAGLNANGGDANINGGINPVTNNVNIAMKSADMRAVGIAQVANCVPQATGNGTLNGNVPNTCIFGTGANAYDGIISLNTAITFPPQPSGTNFGLLAVVEHEMDEILGLGSALRGCSPGDPNASAACKAAGNWNLGTAGASLFGNPTPEDLYRWNAATGGIRTVATNCQTPTSAYFSYGPSTGQIAQFNNSCNGGDFGDWASSGGAKTQDAFATAGGNPTIGNAEISALTAIGYTSSVPEPATYVTLLISLAVLGLAKRSRLC